MWEPARLDDVDDEPPQKGDWLRSILFLLVIVIVWVILVRLFGPADPNRPPEPLRF